MLYPKHGNQRASLSSAVSNVRRSLLQTLYLANRRSGLLCFPKHDDFSLSYGVLLGTVPLPLLSEVRFIMPESAEVEHWQPISDGINTNTAADATAHMGN